MRNIFTALVLGIALAGVSFAQSSYRPAQRAGVSAKTTIAVVEFTPGAGTGLTDHEAKRQLQAYVASQIAKTHKFDVADVRNTRSASNDLASLNGTSTAAAVKLGKQMSVSYVLTGTVPVYDTKLGQITLKTRLVEVATGKVKYSGQVTGNSVSPMRKGSTPEMIAFALKPAVAQLTAQLTGM